MQIEITDRTYKLLMKEAAKTTNGDIKLYLEQLMMDETEIIPTRKEKTEWKTYLYDSLVLLATERPQFMPRKKDNLETLKDAFFTWAADYNDGYFSEQDEADTDRYCAWLTQEYEKYSNNYDFASN